jgi:hypothetical protein
MAKARRKEKAKIAEKGKTAAEIEKKQQEVEDIYGKRQSKSLDPDNIDQSVVEKLPKPTGWRILILPYMGAERSKGGIILADQTREREQLATVCGYVVLQINNHGDQEPCPRHKKNKYRTTNSYLLTPAETPLMLN